MGASGDKRLGPGIRAREAERLLEAAKEAFTRSGADTSLEDIAKQAGVGPGTSYRHFPTREALLEAVYRSEMERLATAEQKLAETVPPIEALRAWRLLFVDAVATKQIIAPALNTLVGDPKKIFEASYAQIHEAIRALVKRAIKNGDIRKDLDPIDLLRALVGVANVATGPDWQRKWPPLSRPFFRRNKLRIGESDFEIRGDRSRPRYSGA